MNNNKRESDLPDERRELIEKLYVDHYGMLFEYAARVMGSRIIAEDLVQDAFCEAVYKAAELSAHVNPVGWLMNTLKNKMRSLKRKANFINTDSESCKTELVRIEGRYGLAELHVIMEQVFSEEEQRLFYLYFVQGYSAKELAGQVGISVNAFKVRMHRLKLRLLEQMKDISLAAVAIFVFWIRI